MGRVPAPPAAATKRPPLCESASVADLTMCRDAGTITVALTAREASGALPCVGSERTGQPTNKSALGLRVSHKRSLSALTAGISHLDDAGGQGRRDSEPAVLTDCESATAKRH